MNVALANQEHEARIALRLDHHVFPTSGQRGCRSPSETSTHHRRSPVFLLNHDHRPNG
jgi:hypothetical protein